VFFRPSWPDRFETPAGGKGLRVRIFLCVPSFFLIPLCLHALAEATPVTDAGKAAARIVVPDAATATERFAAEELRDYLKKVSGATLRIETESQASASPRLCVGRLQRARSAARDLQGEDPDAFLVRTVDADALLLGASDRGTLYAVYDLLERDLGCRWLAPGPEWEETPARATVVLPPLDRLERPAMKYRYLRMTTPGPPGSLNDLCLSWAARRRVNIGTYWPPSEPSEEIGKRGGFRAWMGPHTLYRFVEGKNVATDHPDWLPLINGKRRPPKDWKFGNLCTSPRGRRGGGRRRREVFRRLARGGVCFPWPGRRDGVLRV